MRARMDVAGMTPKNQFQKKTFPASGHHAIIASDVEDATRRGTRRFDEFKIIGRRSCTVIVLGSPFSFRSLAHRRPPR